MRPYLTATSCKWINETYNGGVWAQPQVVEVPVAGKSSGNRLLVGLEPKRKSRDIQGS